MMQKFLAIIFIPFLPLIQGYGQQITLEDSLGNVLLTIDKASNAIRDDSGKVVWSIRGNLIYKGEKFQVDSTVFILKDNDLFGKKKRLIYGPDLEHVYFSFRKGKLFIGQDHYDQNLLFTIKGNAGGLLGIYDRASRLHFSLPGTGLNPSLLIAALLYYARLQEMIREDEPGISAWDYLPGEEGVVGRIYPQTGTDYYFEWLWDGKILKPAYGNRTEDEWIFDGKYLRPYWSMGVSTEWHWDGHLLRPYLSGDQRLVFEWDADMEELRPYWETRLEDEWRISTDEGTARPKWNADLRNQWTIEGEIPIPLIALVVMGFADRTLRH